MDPDKAYNDICEAISKDYLANIKEPLQNLRNWIAKDGFLPKLAIEKGFIKQSFLRFLDALLFTINDVMN